MQRLLLALVLAWLPVLAASIQRIEVVGADPVLTTLAEIALPVREGDPVEKVDPEAIRRAVLATGYFQDAKVELKDGTLRVAVVPNPPVAEVEVEARAFPPEKLAATLARELALEAGTTYNPQKAEEGRKRLEELYRQQGFPFAPKVELAVEKKEDGVHLRYRVEETAPVRKVEVRGATLVDPAAVRKAFAPLVEKKTFDWSLYLAGVRRVAELYQDKGYRGSGVDPARTQLADGVLTVRLRELKVASVEPDGLPEAPLKVGEPFNYDRLVDRVAELTRELGRVVRFRVYPEGSDGVRVVFALGERRYGPIKAIRIEGATAFPPEQLAGLLVQRPGDPFSPQLVQADFERILAHYQKAGYLLLQKLDYAFEQGVYTLRLHEVRIAGYRLRWQGGHRTQDFVVLRELPAPGSLFSIPALREGIGKLLRLGILAEPPGVNPRPTEAPDRVLVELDLKEAKTVVIAPAVAWSSQSGWSGQVTLSDKNLWGRAHDAGLNLAFVENDAGDNLSFSLHYNVPWLYLDFADLKKTPTSVGLAFSSIPYGNFKLRDGSGQETGWEYTERRTGLSLTAGRPLGERWRIDAGLEAQWVGTLLETKNPPAHPTVPEPVARTLLPSPYANGLLAGTLTYRDADDPAFPTTGRVAALHLGYGLVFPTGSPAAGFAPTWASYKTYAAEDPVGRSVFALRVAAGAIWGAPPESRYFTLGGSEPELATLRGYNPREFSGTRLLAGSLEYRYDFRLSTAVTRTIIGIAFVDFGSVWNPGDDPNFHAGWGLGVQLNLGYGAVQFPALRFDYGFSAQHPGGVLHFRIGPVF